MYTPSIQYSKYPFSLPPLPYDYDALEPYIDAETMHYHHDKHFQTYINNLNKVLEKYPGMQELTLQQILMRPVGLPPDDRDAVLNNAGGVYNHALFFDGMAPASQGGHEPPDRLFSQIKTNFGTLEKLKEQLTEAALGVFGSGWACLGLTRQGKLRILTLKNQETAIRQWITPLLMVDVWEHAYYLKYKNNRKEYAENLWHVLVFPEI